MTISSYPKVWNLGHPNIADLFSGTVFCQEKIDGSQFSFGVDSEGHLQMRSKGQAIYDASQGGRIGSWQMFEAGIAAIESIRESLAPGYVYRGEYLMKAKHNGLAYDRVPTLNVILFDVETTPHQFMGPVDLECEAQRIGLEHVPYYEFDGEASPEWVMAQLERVSCLGGQKIEGVVFKNYDRFGADGKTLMGKYVSEAFKEVQRTSWKTDNPSQTDMVDRIGQSLRTPARWNKAIQHLKERGELTNSPKDIGPLLDEVKTDLLAEEADRIKETLFKWAYPKIARIASSGLPEFYKKQLLEQQFGGSDA